MAEQEAGSFSSPPRGRERPSVMELLSKSPLTVSSHGGRKNNRIVVDRDTVAATAMTRKGEKGRLPGVAQHQQEQQQHPHHHLHHGPDVDCDGSPPSSFVPPIKTIIINKGDISNHSTTKDGDVTDETSRSTREPEEDYEDGQQAHQPVVGQWLLSTPSTASSLSPPSSHLRKQRQQQQQQQQQFLHRAEMDATTSSHQSPLSLPTVDLFPINSEHSSLSFAADYSSSNNSSLVRNNNSTAERGSGGGGGAVGNNNNIGQLGLTRRPHTAGPSLTPYKQIERTESFICRRNKRLEMLKSRMGRPQQQQQKQQQRPNKKNDGRYHKRRQPHQTNQLDERVLQTPGSTDQQEDDGGGGEGPEEQRERLRRMTEVAGLDEIDEGAVEQGGGISSIKGSSPSPSPPTPTRAALRQLLMPSNNGNDYYHHHHNNDDADNGVGTGSPPPSPRSRSLSHADDRHRAGLMLGLSVEEDSPNSVRSETTGCRHNMKGQHSSRDRIRQRRRRSLSVNNRIATDPVVVVDAGVEQGGHAQPHIQQEEPTSHNNDTIIRQFKPTKHHDGPEVNALQERKNTSPSSPVDTENGNAASRSFVPRSSPRIPSPTQKKVAEKVKLAAAPLTPTNGTPSRNLSLNSNHSNSTTSSSRQQQQLQRLEEDLDAANGIITLQQERIKSLQSQKEDLEARFDQARLDHEAQLLISRAESNWATQEKEELQRKLDQAISRIHRLEEMEQRTRIQMERLQSANSNEASQHKPRMKQRGREDTDEPSSESPFRGRRHSLGSVMSDAIQSSTLADPDLRRRDSRSQQKTKKNYRPVMPRGLQDQSQASFLDSALHRNGGSSVSPRRFSWYGTGSEAV